MRENGELDAAPQNATEATEESTEDLHDFWSKVVEQQQEAEKATKAAQAATVGRGKRRRANVRCVPALPWARLTEYLAQVNYKIGAESPQKKNKEVDSKSPSAHDHSSGDEYRLRPDELDSDDEAPVAMDVDEGLNDVEAAAKPPKLARFDSAPNPGATSSDASKSQVRKGAVVTGPAELAALREEKAKKRTAAIDAVLHAAIDLGDKKSQELLLAARVLTSRKEQSEFSKRLVKIANECSLHTLSTAFLLRQATHRVESLRQQLRQHPLAANLAVANQSTSQAKPPQKNLPVDQTTAATNKALVERALVKAKRSADEAQLSEAELQRQADERKIAKRMRAEKRARDLEQERQAEAIQPGNVRVKDKADAQSGSLDTPAARGAGSPSGLPAASAAAPGPAAGSAQPLPKKPTPSSRSPTLTSPSALKPFSLPPQTTTSAATSGKSKSPTDLAAPAMAPTKSGDKSDSSKSSASSSSKYKQSTLSFGRATPKASTSQPLPSSASANATASSSVAASSTSKPRPSASSMDAAKVQSQSKAPTFAAKPSPVGPTPAPVAKNTEILVISDSDDDP